MAQKPLLCLDAEKSASAFGVYAVDCASFLLLNMTHITSTYGPVLSDQFVCPSYIMLRYRFDMKSCFLLIISWCERHLHLILGFLMAISVLNNQLAISQFECCYGVLERR